MNILVIAPTPFFADRGTHIRILEEALALDRLGHAITIATYHIGKDIPPEVGTDIDVQRIRGWLFWYRKLEAGPDWQKIVLDIMLLRKVAYLAWTQHPNIIHAHLHEGALIGWVVQKLLFWRKIRLVTDFHGSLTREMVAHAYLRTGVLRWIFRRIERWINARGEMAVTSSWESMLEVSAVRPSETTETVSDGVNLSYYRALPSGAEACRRIGIPTDRVIITCTGASVSDRQSIRHLLEAFSIVHAECSDVYFVLAGFSPKLIRAMTQGWTWTRDAKFISPSPYFQLPLLLWASDIGVNPKAASARQVSGRVLQYMGAGLPIACFDTASNREYIDGGGEFATDINGERLAEAIIRLVRDEKLREEKGLINHRRAERFSWDVSAKQLEGIYKRVLHSK